MTQKPPKLLTEEEVIARLRVAVACSSSVAIFANKYKLSRTFIDWVLSGRRPPSKAILTILNLERVIGYRYKKVTRK